MEKKLTKIPTKDNFYCESIKQMSKTREIQRVNGDIGKAKDMANEHVNLPTHSFPAVSDCNETA